MLHLDAAAGSHPGHRRPGNEDSGYAGPSLLLVADGVGGASAGDVASAAATLVAARLAARWRGTDPVAVLEAVVREARADLREHLEVRPDHVGMATTLTAVLIDGVRCALVHLGDSRAYVLRRGRLVQVTQDHTLVRELVAAGTLTPEQALTSPYRHQLVQCLSADATTPDLGHLELAAGDRLLLCSDGLSDMVAEADVARLLATGAPDDAVAALIEAALDAGGHDNVTCVVGDVVGTHQPAAGGHVVGAAQAEVRGDAAVR